jgi:hypothetical protein
MPSKKKPKRKRVLFSVDPHLWSLFLDMIVERKLKYSKVISGYLKKELENYYGPLKELDK